jgi:hypothetical protein
MQTLTLEITNETAMRTLRTLASRNAIRIVATEEINSPALPGTPLNITAFKQWIAAAELTPAISLKNAKSAWESRKKQLQGLGK